MSRTRKIIFCVTLLLMAGGGFVEQGATARQQKRLAAQAEEIARLEAAVRQRRKQLADLQAQDAKAQEEVVAHRKALATAEASSTMKLWSNRIALLKRLLAEMPKNGIPEIRLLTPTDWVQVVRTRELDSADEIRSAFLSITTTARKKMAAVLQEALKAYLKTSEGELPTDLGQLAPYLKPPADLEMLQRYAMVRTGKAGEPDEHVIRESALAELVLSVGQSTFDIRSNPDWSAPEGETLPETLRRQLAGLGPIFEELGGEKDLSTMLPLPAMMELMERYKPKVEAAFGDGEQFGQAIKVAVKRFSAANSGRSPEDMAELVPFFENSEKVAALAGPFAVELKYLIDHEGQVAKDPAQLQRYMTGGFNPQEVLRMLKITVNEESVSMNIKWGASTSKE